jgi:hypothetical protein
MGTASKCAALGVAVGWGCGSPAQDSDRGYGVDVSQRAKAVVLVDVVSLVALDLATPPTWSDPGGPALQLHLARRVNCRRGGNDLRDNATGTSDGYSPVSAETPDGSAPESFMDAGGSSRCADPKIQVNGRWGQSARTCFVPAVT